MTGSFLWVSDIHLDPYYGTARAVSYLSDACQDPTNRTKDAGQVGCDAPLTLVQEAFQQALRSIDNTTTERPFDFILVTGDWCRHATDQLEDPLNATETILSNLSHALLHAFSPSSSNKTTSNILPALGNNDVTPDYTLDVKNPTEMLSMVSRGLAPLFWNDVERATFARGGYLARNVSQTLTIVSINTVIYSTNHLPQYQYLQDDDPLSQFAWLQDELKTAQASHHRVYVVGHIPPTVGSFRHSQMWHDQYLTTYLDLITPHLEEGTIVGHLFGHLHSDEFRLLNDNDNNKPKIPLLLASSITPIYGSNPSIRVVTYEGDDSGTLLDYDTYYLPLNNNNSNSMEEISWRKAPSFQESFGVPNLNATSLESIVHQLKKHNQSSILWKAITSRQHVLHDDDDDDDASICDVQCQTQWICTLTSMTRSDYDKCLKQQQNDDSTSIIKVAMVVILLCMSLAVAMWVVCQRQRHRRRHYHSQLMLDNDIDHTTATSSSGGVVLSISSRGAHDDGHQRIGLPPSHSCVASPHEQTPPKIT